MLPTKLLLTYYRCFENNHKSDNNLLEDLTNDWDYNNNWKFGYSCIFLCLTNDISNIKTIKFSSTKGIS